MKRIGIGLIAISALAASLAQADNTRCKRVRADLVEVSSTEGCKPGHASCFLGEVDGNNGLNGVTYFKGDSSGTAPPTSPGSYPYSGLFEYHTGKGSLFMRETGITVPGAVTAHQAILEGTGDYAGATGYFFVSGLRANGVIDTQITGEICYPRGH